MGDTAGIHGCISLVDEEPEITALVKCLIIFFPQCHVASSMSYMVFIQVSTMCRFSRCRKFRVCLNYAHLIDWYCFKYLVSLMSTMACQALPCVMVCDHSVLNTHQTPVATCAQLQCGKVIPATLPQCASRHRHALAKCQKYEHTAGINGCKSLVDEEAESTALVKHLIIYFPPCHVVNWWVTWFLSRLNVVQKETMWSLILYVVCVCSMCM